MTSFKGPISKYRHLGVKALTYGFGGAQSVFKTGNDECYAENKCQVDGEVVGLEWR